MTDALKNTPLRGFKEMMFTFPLYILTHPFKGFDDMKFQKRGDMRYGIIILLAAGILSILREAYTGFVVSGHFTETPVVNVPSVLLFTYSPIILFCIANWSVTVITDGNGNMREIFLTYAYAMYPMIFLTIAGIFISNYIMNNINVQFSHWTNGGMLTRTLHNLRPLRTIGGRRGMRELEEFSQERGISLFPAVRAGTIIMAVGRFQRPGRNSFTRNIGNHDQLLPWFNMMDRGFGGAARMLSPNFWISYSQRIVRNFTRIGLSNIAVTDMGWLLFGNYGRRYTITRLDALEYAEKMLRTLNEETGLMLTNPNAYAFAHASVITDLPFHGGFRRIVCYTVPFTQMVLENHVPFGMPAYNIDPMNWRGFNEYMMRAVESRSGMQLILTKQHEAEFFPTFRQFWVLNQMFFQTEFRRWEGRIGDYFTRFRDFHDLVNGAVITSHTVFGGGLHVIVEYSNGVSVYLNYAESPWEINGKIIGGIDFKVVQYEQ